MNKKTLFALIFLMLIGIVSAQNEYSFLDVARYNINITGNIETMFIKFTEFGDDKGVSIEGGQFSVGTPLDPREAVFGGGDSTTEGMIVLHYNGSDYTDVTTILASDNGSVTGLFGGNLTNYTIYVGSNFTYGGVKAKINISGLVEPDNVVGQYWNGTHWDSVKFMATKSDFPYTQLGNTLASSSGSEQWRFGLNKYPWLKSTINGYEKYWGRFMITSDITQDPQLEQIKLHTNRFEINTNGFTEYYGNARYERSIPIQKRGNFNKNPPNENIEIAVGMTEIRENNEFTANANDGFILSGVIPQGMDTSIPVQLIIDWYPKGSGSGNVELQLETIVANPGFIYDGTAVPVSSPSLIIPIDNQEGELQRSVFLVDNSNALPEDKVYGSLYRDGTAGSNDTYGSSIVITGYQVVGYFWKP